MCQEKWRDINGFEGAYQVSDIGRIRSLDRCVNNKSNTGTRIKGTIMKLQQNHKGYMTVVLHKHNKPYTKLVHRLVAEAFINNSDHLPQINHKDTNKQNNRVENLEWVTNQDNMQHAIRNGCFENSFTEKTKTAVLDNLKYARKARIKGVIQLDLQGNIVDQYESISNAEQKTGVSNSKICMCCKGKRKTAGGYMWKYKEELA